MTEEEYTHERAYWIARLSAIPRRKHFPRCVRYRLMQLARVEAAYRGTDFISEYEKVKNAIWTYH